MIPRASKKVLTQNLRDLEATGIVTRRDLSDVVLHVEYELKQDVKDSVFALLGRVAGERTALPYGVPVWHGRDDVLSEKDLQTLAQACIAHEAAHVEHEGHLYRTFPGIYGRPLECGDRSRQTFLKAMDVWSEYAACRSSATFRPEAVEEFEGLFCRALEESLAACRERIAAYRIDQKAAEAFRDIQQLFGDAFIHARYSIATVSLLMAS
jgi:hypothetical protein